MKNSLVKLIRDSKDVVVFTGAGISTESGIPDFRSSSGLYASGKFQQWTPEQILSKRFFIKNPEIFYEFYKERLLSMSDKKPNRSHKILAEWESSGKVKAVVTQNIDNLHQTAGSKVVMDLHGNGSVVRCCVCLKKYPTSYMHEQLETSPIPRCECGAKVRPMTVLFDEWLDDDVFDSATKVMKMADLVVVIGTSLVVHPAASLLSEINEECKLVILNNTKTPYDSVASLLINEPCGDILEYVKERL